MRLSTYYMYQHNLDGFSRGINNHNAIYERLSAQRNVLRPSDDPAATSQAVALQEGLAKAAQYDTARQQVRAALQLEDDKLSAVGNLLTQNLSEKIVAAGNGALSDSDRQALATEIQAIRDNLRDIGNTRDSSGRYIFAGYSSAQQPFDENGQYLGHATAMTRPVSDSSEMACGHTGSKLFMSGSSDDLLAQLDKAVAALNQPVGDDSDREALRLTLDDVNRSIKNGIDNLGKIQAEVGTSLQQLDSLDLSAATQTIDLETRLQETVGADYDTLIGMIGQSKMSEFALNSSMMVFQNMQKMSIFTMVG